MRRCFFEWCFACLDEALCGIKAPNQINSATITTTIVRIKDGQREKKIEVANDILHSHDVWSSFAQSHFLLTSFCRTLLAPCTPAGLDPHSFLWQFLCFPLASFYSVGLHSMAWHWHDMTRVSLAISRSFFYLGIDLIVSRTGWTDDSAFGR